MVRKGWINFVSYALEVLAFEICRPNFLLHINLVPWFVKKGEFIKLNEYIFSFWFTIHNINLWSTLCIPKFYIRLKFSRFSNKHTDSPHSFGSIHSFMKNSEEPEIKLPTSAGSSKKQESSRKTCISARPLTVWITINCGKFWKRWEYQTTWPAYWETYMQVRKQQLEPGTEQQTGK